MDDTIEDAIQLLETAYGQQDWGMVIEVIEMLSKLEDDNLSLFEDDELPPIQ